MPSVPGCGDGSGGIRSELQRQRESRKSSGDRMRNHAEGVIYVSTLHVCAYVYVYAYQVSEKESKRERERALSDKKHVLAMDRC